MSPDVFFSLEFTHSLKARSRREASSLQNNPRGTLIVLVIDLLLQVLNASLLVQHERRKMADSVEDREPSESRGDPHKTHIKHTPISPLDACHPDFYR